MINQNLVVLDVKNIDGFYKNYNSPTVSFFLNINFSVDREEICSYQNRMQSVFPGFKINDSDCVSVLYIFKAMYRLAWAKSDISFVNFAEYEIKSSFEIFCVVKSLGESSQHINVFLKYLCNYVESFVLHDDDEFNKNTDLFFDFMRKYIKNILPGQNNKLLIRAATTLNIPWVKLSPTVIQIGWGKKSKLFNSSFSEITSSIAVNLSNNKLLCSNLLKDIGLPVMPNMLVSSAQIAVKFANKFGYPLVIKPVNGAKGVGVYSKLNNEIELVDAFNKCSSLYSKVMIEKFYPGKDYRFVVVDGVVVRAVERIPCFVQGDGVHTVEELIKVLNDKRLTEYNGFGLIYPDSEMIELLSKRNLTLNYIPQLSEKIELRNIANISLGGSLISVLDIAHKDNIELAKSAALNMRLDISGVDILINDISKSWKDTGAHICEVNAQPQLTSDMAQFILEKRLCNDGRIPVFVVVLDDIKSCNKLLNIGKSGIEIIYVEEHSPRKSSFEYYKLFNSAIKNLSTEKIFVIYNSNDIKGATVFPFDVCNVLYDFSSENIQLLFPCLHNKALDIVIEDVCNFENFIKLIN